MTAKDKLKFVMHNVENLFVFMDKYEDEDLSTIDETAWQSFSTSLYVNKALKKTLELATTFLVSDPDVIMLTEVGGPESLENFNKFFLNSRYTSYIIEGNSDRGIDLGYLVKKNLSLNASVESHKERPIMFLYPDDRRKLTKKNSLRFSRDVLELKLFDQAKKVYFIVLLVHLKSKLDKDKRDLEGKRRRKAELECLINIYEEKKKQYPEIPIILTGDFNGNATKYETEHEFKAIYERTSLEDFSELIKVPLEERFSYLYFDNLDQCHKMQLDYFFIEKNFTPMLDGKETCFMNFRQIDGELIDYPQNWAEKVRLPSDHYPLEIVFLMQHHPFLK